ncbi:GNAT family N-acetyltransferase [Halomonas organivorans]|uniref:Ribosomal protein S18 acetylase RimI-like enzyme n=1 Tax=Halomonas organivorans TaxID=257772 RepID=A0A7W5G417_9GAMM|nr:GNAT family N-acetyltransferase [Halomonas organivorans]MBB3139669.1 ribosomal protein S18 acetylase RimI-like enzyme [Halomonas organivorans]
MADVGGHLNAGLHLRPSRDSDKGFLESLYRDVRQDLQLLAADRDFIEAVLEMQVNAQSIGYGSAYPNALYYIVEKQGERIGRVTVDFGADVIHVIDLALIRAARNRGYGAVVLQAVQSAATQVMTPVSLSVDPLNTGAKLFYQRLGFRFEALTGAVERWTWHPHPPQLKTS